MDNYLPSFGYTIVKKQLNNSVTLIGFQEALPTFSNLQKMESMTGTSELNNSQLIQTRRSSETRLANVDLSKFYLVENLHTKQRHVISHLFVKQDCQGSQSRLLCKTTPRGTRFEAKVLLKGIDNTWR